MNKIKSWISTIRYKQTVYKKNKWCRSLKVGDLVCDCRGKHLKIVEIYKDDPDPLLEDGSSPSLLACCEPVKADSSCHNYYMNQGYDDELRDNSV